MIKFKNLIISILIPLAAGFIGNLLGNSSQGYNELIQPSFAPPGFIFPIVWTILYTLMGISFYIIYNSNSEYRTKAIIVYFIQLILNTLWTLIFFRLNLLLFAFIWIITIIVFVILMIYYFSKINKIAAYLQIPYLLWLIFAGILNFSIYLLNS